jgi:hypothetical protein
MGFFNDLHELRIQDAKIFIEGRTLGLFSECCLIIGGVKKDQIRGMLETFYMYGKIQAESFRVKIEQGLFETKSTVEFQDEVLSPWKVH